MTKVGIIGCGVIAPTHIGGYRLPPGAEAVFLPDIEPGRMAEKGGSAGRSRNCRELPAAPEAQPVKICRR